MALFDDIYDHKNTRQSIEDAEVAETFEALGKELKNAEEEYEKSKKSSMFDEKAKKRQRIITMLNQAAKYIEDSDIDPDSVSIKISIGKDYKLKYKGNRTGVFMG